MGTSVNRRTQLTAETKQYCSIVPSNMAQLVVTLVLLYCVSGFHRVSSLSLERNKRHVGEQSVQSVLQSFISRLDVMQNQIQQQDRKLATQKKEIRDLKWYLKRKGTKERLEEIQRDVDYQTKLIKYQVNIKSLIQFKNSVDNFEKRLKVLTAVVKERKKVINDIYARIVLPDRKIVCRDTFTSWHKQADYKIGALAKHEIECRDDELLQRFLLERKDGGHDSVIRFKYRCCRYNIKDKWTKSPKRMTNQQ